MWTNHIFPLVFPWKYIKKMTAVTKLYCYQWMLFGETLFCCFFSIQLFGRFFWLLFSSIGNKLQIIVGFGASLTKKKKKKGQNLTKCPLIEVESLSLTLRKICSCQRTSKKCFILWCFQSSGNGDSLNPKSRWMLAHTFAEFLSCSSITIWLWNGHCWGQSTNVGMSYFLPLLSSQAAQYS